MLEAIICNVAAMLYLKVVNWLVSCKWASYSSSAIDKNSNKEAFQLSC